MRIREFVSLKKMTTLKIGGVARYFCAVERAEELSEALAFAREKRINLVVFGGGSNVLIADEDIDALIIKIDIKGIGWKEDSEDVLVVAGAGESWDGLVAKAVRRELWGVENLSGIPGTVGAAPIQNIGAYGTEIKETLAWVEVFDTRSGKFRTLSNKECKFGYRDSIFKRPKGKSLIITRVALWLKKSGTPNLEYKDLKERFRIYDLRFKKKRLTPLDIRKTVLEIRSRKFPDLRTHGTAGSFFKNPIISQGKFNKLKKKFPDLPGFPIFTRFKIPLAWILDNVCGLKGFCKGNVTLFEPQPIVIVQNGKASAEEIKSFAKEISDKVKAKTDIDIEWEIQQIW